MKHKKLFLGLFVLLALAQLFLPFNMIQKQTKVTMEGATFKFRIRHLHKEAFERRNTGASIQGKYLWLPLEEALYKPGDMNDREDNQHGPAYVTFFTDSLGFAKVQSLSWQRPSGTRNYVEAIARTDMIDTTSLIIMYPFRKYYIADKNTEDINEGLNKKLKDTLTTNYLVVKIRDGKYLTSDLVIDGLSFKDFVSKIREKK